MNKLILVATLWLFASAAIASDESQLKDTKHEGKYLNLVDATKAFKLAKQMNKRVFVYQDWPL